MRLTARHTTIGDCVVRIRLTPEANGCAYAVYRGFGEIVCCGWAAGTRAEACEEARSHAHQALTKKGD